MEEDLVKLLSILFSSYFTFLKVVNSYKTFQFMFSFMLENYVIVYSIIKEVVTVLKAISMYCVHKAVLEGII